MRVNHPAGWFYKTDALRAICDIWERHGSGLTNLHGATGDIILLGTRTENLEAAFADLTAHGFDLGGSGSVVRTPSCCVGPARCEWACFDTLALIYDLTMHFQDSIHRPSLPYKFKIKASGCPNDCVASIARADLSIIGTWRDAIRVDQAAVREAAASGIDIRDEVCERCPGRCMTWKDDTLAIDDGACVRCMHCINVLPKALGPGRERGACIHGGKAPIVQAAPRVAHETAATELKELIEKILELGRRGERERRRLIQRVGLELPRGHRLSQPEMVLHLRRTYVFYEEDTRTMERRGRAPGKEPCRCRPEAPNRRPCTWPVPAAEIRREHGKRRYHQIPRPGPGLRGDRDGSHRAMIAAPPQRRRSAICDLADQSFATSGSEPAQHRVPADRPRQD
jgi:sulfite reductase alpha subunit